MIANKENAVLQVEHEYVLSVQPVHSNSFGLFPSESQAGVTFSRAERLDLSRQYSKLYRLYIQHLSESISNEYNISELAAKVLVRRAVVPMLHCFLERLIRINKFIKHVGTNVVLPSQCIYSSLEFIEDFQNAAVSDPEFNQSLINNIGQIWQLSQDSEVIEYINTPTQSSFKNNLVYFYSGSVWRILKKIKLKILASLPLSKFPTISLSNDYNVFFENNFYFRCLRRINMDWSISSIESNQELREKFFSYSENSNFYDEFMLFLSLQGLSSNQQNRALEIFKQYMISYYPTSLLESIPENIRNAEMALQPFKKNALICSGAGNTKSTFIIALAKKMGMKVIKCQHGGYYGYLEDTPQFLEIEYPDADIFISWGWKQPPDYYTTKKMHVKDLPSPWLSERKKYWRNYKFAGTREYDFLFMPNMVKRFPFPPHGASTARIELIHEYIADIKAVVKAIAENDLSILHKPYNTTTVQLLKNTMSELELLGGGKYSCISQLDKGLTYELINKCHLVLWDYPGTGFLECISSNIPTMIYWPRTYVHEEECAKNIFLELEKHKIVHTDMDSLITEYEIYKRSPKEWMNNNGRVNAANKFCREYAWASEDWVDYWKNYLNELEG